MITLILKLIALFFLTFIFHEVAHGLEAIRQGSSSFNIKFIKWPPSLHIGADHITNSDMFSLAGGLYTGLLCLFYSLITIDPEIHVSLVTMGACQCYYGIYEMYDTQYRYLLYFVVICSSLLFYHSLNILI